MTMEVPIRARCSGMCAAHCHGAGHEAQLSLQEAGLLADWLRGVKAGRDLGEFAFGAGSLTAEAAGGTVTLRTAP